MCAIWEGEVVNNAGVGGVRIVRGIYMHGD